MHIKVYSKLDNLSKYIHSLALQKELIYYIKKNESYTIKSVSRYMFPTKSDVLVKTALKYNIPIFVSSAVKTYELNKIALEKYNSLRLCVMHVKYLQEDKSFSSGLFDFDKDYEKSFEVLSQHCETCVGFFSYVK